MPPVNKTKKEEQALQKVNDNLKLQEISLTTTVEDLLASGSLPPGINTKEKIMTITQYGKELGMTPMTAINSISLVSGRMVISSKILGSMLKAKGYEFVWTADWAFDEEKQTNYSEIRLYWYSSILKREMSDSLRMTWNELERAGLTDRDTYKKYPKFMLRARTMSAAIDKIAPEVRNNIYTAEELADTDPSIKLNIDEEGNVSATVDAEYIEVKD
jgi:hypothetical protein